MAHKIPLTKKQGKIVCLVASAFFALLFALESFAMVQSFSAYQWKATNGVVESSYLAYQRRSRKHEVDYSYVVDGSRYRSDRIRFSGMKFGIPWTWARMNPDVYRFSKGANVTVYYDPSNPNEAVLKRGLSLGGVVSVFAHLALCIGLFRGGTSKK